EAVRRDDRRHQQLGRRQHGGKIGQLASGAETRPGGDEVDRAAVLGPDATINLRMADDRYSRRRSLKLTDEPREIVSERHKAIAECGRKVLEDRRLPDLPSGCRSRWHERPWNKDIGGVADDAQSELAGARQSKGDGGGSRARADGT